MSYCSKINNVIFNPFSEPTFDVKNYVKNIRNYFELKEHSILKKYQVVIMAAGKGSRMKIDKPKTLFELKYPNGKKTILKNLIDIVELSTDNIIDIKIVINKNHKVFYQNILNKNKNIKLIELEENQIKGTAQCLYHSKFFLNNNLDIILLWGDLSLIPSSYLYYSILIHEKFNPLITMPTRYKKTPYVSFVRDKNGIFNNVFHSNEGNQLKGFAEQDCLSFIVSPRIFEFLEDFIKIKKDEKEVDFIHFIPYCTNINFSVIGLPFANPKKINGINNMEKAKFVQKKLDEYDKKLYKKIYLEKKYFVNF